MRAAALFAMVATSPLAAATLSKGSCTFDNASETASYISCGDISRILPCLSEMSSLDQIKGCLRSGSCSELEAATGAQILRTKCDQSSEGNDLEIRQFGQFGGNAQQEASSVVSSVKGGKTQKTTAVKQSPTPTPDPTTVDTPTDTPTDTPAADSNTPTPATPSSTPNTPASTPTTLATTPATTAKTSTNTPAMATTPPASTPTTGPLVCQTTTQSSYTWCVTSTGVNGTPTPTCTPTTTPIVECAPGLICQTQPGAAAGDAGMVTCMVRQNNLTTSGLVVTIFFGVVVLGFIVSVCAMFWKSRKTDKAEQIRRERAMLMASAQEQDMGESHGGFLAGDAGRDRGAFGSEAYLPLMSAAAAPAAGGGGGGRGAPAVPPVPQHYQYGSGSGAPSPMIQAQEHGMDYVSSRPAAQGYRGPSGGGYQDVPPRVPVGGALRLHPGLMGPPMNDGEEDMGVGMGYGRGGML